jgi:prepilin-type N-terminal cleavage/methylation domain-containing protein
VSGESVSGERNTNDMKRNQAYSKHQSTRRGLTLVELLVVIVILSLVTAATIPLMQPATAERRIREAARMVAATLANAQSRALATGRPVGVMFQRLSNQTNDLRAQHSIEMFLCEVPLPWSGDDPNDFCVLNTRTNAAGRPETWIRFTRPGNQAFYGHPKGTFEIGDQIRLSYRGRRYVINDFKSHPQDPNSIYELLVQPPPIDPGTQQMMPFQIYRQPRKSADAPAQMPVGAIVDLEYAGPAFSSPSLGLLLNQQPPLPKLSLRQPVIVMFGPSGNLESVYWGMKAANEPDTDPGALQRSEPISPFFLLIGQPPGDDAVTQGKPNHRNFDNVWIAINPQSGLVTTSEVGSEIDVETGNSSADTSREIDASRELARTSQNMGGR